MNTELEQNYMQRETLSVVHRSILVLAGLGAVDYVTLEPLSERRSLRRKYPTL